MAKAEGKQKAQITMDMVVRYYKVPAVVGVVMAVVIYVAWMQLGSALKGYSEFSQGQKKLETIEERIRAVQNKLGGNYEATKQVADRSLPQEKPIFEAFTALMGIANENGLTIINLSSTPGSLATESAELVSTNKRSQASDKVESLGVSMKVEGNETQVNALLANVSRVVPLMDINKVSISVRGGTENNPEVVTVADIDLSVYWMLPEQQGTARTTTAAPVVELTSQNQNTVRELLNFKYYGVN